MFDANFIERLFTRSIDHMATNNWEWPEDWNLERKKMFLKHCLEYAEQREMYEQCEIMRDVGKELEETWDV